MLNKQGKKTLGPIQKIVVPRFDFQQAEKEERFVEDVLEAQHNAQDVDPRQIGLSLKNQKLKAEFDMAKPQDTNQELFREKMSQNKAVFRTKVTKFDQALRIKSKNMVSADFGMQIKGPQFYSPSNDFSQNPSVYSEGAFFKFTNLSFKENGSIKFREKIFSKALSQQGTQTEQRTISNHQIPMQTCQAPIIMLPSKGISERNTPNLKNVFFKNRKTILVEDDSAPEDNPISKAFALGGLNSNKNLKNYDCWDDDKNHLQWLKECQQTMPPHAKCPIFDKNKLYTWTNVEVIDYDPITCRFKVRVMSTQVEKWIGRLSLMFLTEDQVKFQERVELSKQRQRNADDEMRFYNYVNTQVDRVASFIPIEIKSKVSDFAQIRSLPYLKKVDDSVKQPTAVQANPDDDKQLNANVQALQEELLAQISNEYVLMMKKCYVMREMEFNRDDPKWIKLRIKNRFERQQKKYYGLYYQIQNLYTEDNQWTDHYLETRSQLMRLHYSARQLVVETLNMIAARSQQFQAFPVLNILLNQNQLPMSLSNFEAQQKQHNIQAKQTLQVQWRSYIVSEIQDKLRDIYRFYQTETQLYRDSELQKLLRRIDAMFNTYVRDNVLEYQVKIWCKFIEKFIVPLQHDSDIWKINEYPMLVLNLEVNLNFKKKKEKRKAGKNEKKEVEELEVAGGEDAITYEPSYTQILQVLIKPLEWLVETVNSYDRLEKDLVPLIGIEKLRSYEISMENEWIQWGVKKIEEFVKVGYKRANEIIDEFKKYQFLLDRGVNAVIKSLFGDPKDKITILALEREEIHQKLKDYTDAKYEIEKLCIDEKNERFFQIKTRNAKENLITRANEFITQILAKCCEVVTEGINAITKGYTDMYEQILKQPKNEQELVQLKNYIAENDLNLAKMKKEVDCVYEYLLMFEDYCYHYGEKNIESFWYLMQWPTEIKSAVSEGQRNAQSQELKLMENLEQEKEQRQFYSQLFIKKKKEILKRIA